MDMLKEAQAADLQQAAGVDWRQDLRWAHLPMAAKLEDLNERVRRLEDTGGFWRKISKGAKTGMQIVITVGAIAAAAGTLASQFWRAWKTSAPLQGPAVVGSSEVMGSDRQPSRPPPADAK